MKTQTFTQQPVFTDAARLQALKNNLPEAAARINAVGEAMQANFPQLPWNTRAAWVLGFEPEARKHLCQLVMRAVAEAAGLACDWDIEDVPPQPESAYKWTLAPERPKGLSEDARLNRKLVELQTKETRAKLCALAGTAGLADYLRTGALAVGEDGKAIEAPERLDEFCTLYAETAQQATFVADLERMRKAAAEMSAAYLATLALMPAAKRGHLAANSGFYMPTFGRIAKHGEIGLTDADAVPRALISFFSLAKATPDAAPKFYNSAGIWAYTPEDVRALFGFDLDGTQQHQLHPELYPRTVLTLEATRQLAKVSDIYPAIL